MKHPRHMPLKTFVEEYTTTLEFLTRDELRKILLRMASEVKPHVRAEFIQKLCLYSPQSQAKSITLEHGLDPGFDLNILDEIHFLKEDILEKGEEEPDWEFDDEDFLGAYEVFLSPLSGLFDRVSLLFEQGQYEIAQEAYQELFSIFDIEDGYGRGICCYDVEHTDIEKARASYLCSVYMTTQKDRVSLLLKFMEKMGQGDFSTRPTLQEIIDVYPSSLPDFTQFLHEWIEATKSKEKPSHDAWLREATFLLHGSAGLERLAKQEGHKRPRVYIDWIRSLIDTKAFTEALNAGRTALMELPEDQPLRAAIGEFITLCGDHLKDKKCQQEGRWISFKAKPTLTKLISLYEQVQNSNDNNLMQQAIAVTEFHRQRSPRQKNYSKNWYGDDSETPSQPSAILLLHALLFSGEIQKAFGLAKQGKSLGWSFGDNSQPLFIAYCLINAIKWATKGKTEGSVLSLPPYLKQFWETALKTNRESVWHIEGDKSDIRHKLEDIYAGLFENSCHIDPKMLEWCLEAAQKRVEDIVTNQYRNAYDRAALLTAACTDTLRIINPPKAMEFFKKIKNMFSRHSAFQAELGRVNSMKLSRKSRS